MRLFNRLRYSGILSGLVIGMASCGGTAEAPISQVDGTIDGGGGAAGQIMPSEGGFINPVPMSDSAVPSTADVVVSEVTGTGIGQCGDGALQTGEECDDGNAIPGDGCSGICTLEAGFTCPTVGQPCIFSQVAICGNGHLEVGEPCDDGNVVAGDGCSATCQVEAGFACVVAGQPCVAATQNARCGDGQVNAGETCDDGNTVSLDGCSATCSFETGWICSTPGSPCIKNEFCGDGVLQTARGEDCDDGNGTPGDGCSGVCKIDPGYACPDPGSPCTRTWVCGNGKIDPNGENCDDGNQIAGDGCSADCSQVEPGWTCPKAADGTGGPCKLAPQNVCGDAILGPRERCDDGNTMSTDGCSNLCVVEPGWTCPVAGQACTRIAFCGDKVVNLELGEQCDDGATVSGDGCSALCQAEPDYTCPIPGKPCVSTVVCGDGKVTGNEQCDDHNTTANDGCSATCQIESGWQCPTEGARCIAKKCGDSIIAGVEQCDDGNGVSSDGCSATCQVEPGFACVFTGGKSVCHATVCGDGVKEGSEQCDDGNNRPFDGCYQCLRDPQCTGGVCQSVCGDGQRYSDEECDDGNTANGDGCSSLCKVETGFACTDIVDMPPDSIHLPVLFRDFVGQGRTKNGHAAHIDFNQLNGNGVLGIVENALGPTGRPVYSCPGSTHTSLANPNCVTDNNPGHLFIGAAGQRPNMSNAANFVQWYTDVPGTSPGLVGGINIVLPGEVLLTRRTTGVSAGAYRYDSAEAHDNGEGTSIDFFDPLHNKGWVAANFETSTCSPARNVSFTSETHFWFEYQGGERFDFSGDDDTWVYVNGKLAVDLGGLHGRLDGYFTLDADTDGAGPDTADGTAVWGSPNMPGVPAAGLPVNFGLTVGGIYEVVMFQAERNECGSNFTVTLKNFNKPKSKCVSTCGDGIVAADEVCDDGKNDGSYGSCLPGCQGRGPFCGDGALQSAETCDNGSNLVTYGGATKQCGPGCDWAPYCGDGVVSNGEQCDEGALNGSGYGHCTAACRLGDRCGDGTVNGSEQCDDGVNNGASGDKCASDCTERCGNGTPDPGEQCDNGALLNVGGYGKCSPTCTLGPRCGDGFKNGPEQCDDGKNDGSYGTCQADCTLANYCGDNKVTNPPETCDLGPQNSASSYGKNLCSNACKPAPYCGDKAVDGAFGEVCDDGVNSGMPGSCKTDCKGFVPLTSCGDGTVQAPEQCDQGTDNGTPGGTCDTNCRIKCGNGIKDSGEQCDNGVNSGAYGTCKSDCSFAGYCGDGTQNGPEQCDKGAANVSKASAYGQAICTSVCTWAPFCGDGRVDAQFGEECDGTADCEANCKRAVLN